MSLILLMFIHWVFDFILQSDKMAQNKSSSLFWLLSHTVVYSLPFYLFDFRFGLFNFVAHTVIDFFSSKATTYFYKRGQIHNFFVVVGFDQFLHFCCLYLSALHYGILRY